MLRYDEYLSLCLRKSRVGVNHTNVRDEHLVDILLSKGEGEEDICLTWLRELAGKCWHAVDSKTNANYFCYMVTAKPTLSDLAGLDILSLIFKMLGVGFLHI